MCGIIGYIGFEPCYDHIVNGLEQLINRGYDSAGLCTICPLQITKFASGTVMAIDQLKDNHVRDIHGISSIGVGHTRWATHGSVTDANAHPHVSNNNLFVVVHNGIIENASALKDYLVGQGFHFKSETDTEIIANYLEHEYMQCPAHLIVDGHLRVMETIECTLGVLRGTYGLVIICLDQDDRLYCTKYGSPLLISVTDNCGFVVSEQSGFNGKVKEYIVLGAGDIVVMKRQDNKIILESTETYEIKTLTDIENFRNPQYQHWTIQEIFEQQYSIQRALNTQNAGLLNDRLVDFDKVNLCGLDLYNEQLNIVENIILLGCGSSFYAGQLGTFYFKDLCQFNTVQVIDGSEFQENDIPHIGRTVLILMSQSGETKDLHRCIDIGRTRECFLIGIVNVVDSMIAREVDYNCYINAGRENAVASTKSFTSQVAIVALLAIYFAQTKFPWYSSTKRLQYVQDLRLLQQSVVDTLQSCHVQCQQLVQLFIDHNSCFILGKGPCEAIAKEGALKMKELSYIHAEGYSSSALKHGPFALLHEGFPVILLAPTNANIDKLKNTFHEMQSRHATIVYITDDKDDFTECLYKIAIPQNKTFADLLCVIPLQLLSYYLSISKNINPDFPKNLAKVVTVE